jgi:hypothetical protein
VVGAYETRYGTPDVEDVPTDGWPEQAGWLFVL